MQAVVFGNKYFLWDKLLRATIQESKQNIPMEAYLRSNLSITGAETLAWARRLAGDLQLPPWLHLVEAEHTRNERRADEKLLDRLVWLRTDADGAEAEAAGVEAILERGEEEESLVRVVEAVRTPEVARRYMAEDQKTLLHKEKQGSRTFIGRGRRRSWKERNRERERETSSRFWKGLSQTHSLNNTMA